MEPSQLARVNPTRRVQAPHRVAAAAPAAPQPARTPTRTGKPRHSRSPRTAARPKRRGPLVAALGAVAVALVLFVTWIVAGIPTRGGFGGTESMATYADDAFVPLPNPDSIAPVESAPVRANGHGYVDRPEPATMASGLTIPAAAAPPPAVTAKRGIVIDAATGGVLWALNADQPAPMASTVKILTALTTLRFTDPAEMVTVTQQATDVGEREINLSPGEQMDVATLLGAMLVGSANDAAAALGLEVGGTMEGYSAVANWVARRLGARNTSVANPHGLDQPGHVTTAYDLAVLSRAGLSDPVFAQWVRTPEYAVPWPGHPGPRVATSHNKLLRTYAGAIGVKTGMTNGAGNCLVSAATRDGRTFIAVSMSSQNPTGDDVALLDWAFANYTTVKVLAAGDTTTDADGVARAAVTDLVATVPAAQAPDVTARFQDGRLQAVLGGQVVSQVDARRPD